MRAALDRIAAARAGHDARLMVAIAGPPGAGKSTFAAALAAEIEGAAVVPMDGFHLDNSVLEKRGLLPRKGAPETFDVTGFAVLLARLQREADVAIPLFDRKLDKVQPDAMMIGPKDRVLLVEGNYLLLSDPAWSVLHPFWHLTIALDVPDATLEQRLIQRWRDHGLTDEAARARAMGNDIPNARRVLAGSIAAEIVIHHA